MAEAPFLKWAGSKTRYIDKIKTVFPKAQRLVEPFIGSGAVFFNTDFKDNLLCDSNPDLINAFNHLKHTPRQLITYARELLVDKHNNKKAFEELRAEFNERDYDLYRAALFIYLNKSAYNGLCRYSKRSGNFNVSFGRQKSLYFPEKEMLAFNEKAKNATFKVQDFRDTFADAGPGDLYYCDPPYLPLSATSNFTSYDGNPFGLEQHIELRDLAKQARAKGATVVISNNDTPYGRLLYADATTMLMDVNRNISKDPSTRGKVKDILAIYV